MNSRILFLAIISVLVSGCGADRDIDQYNLRKLNEEIAKSQAIAGTYSGEAVLAKDQTDLGNLTIQIQADTKIAPSSNGVTASRQAILKGTLTLDQGSENYISFPEGYFDSNANDVEASMIVNRRNGTQSTIHFKGHIESNTLTGTLEVPGMPESLTTFTLTRGARETSKKSIVTRPLVETNTQNFVSAGSSFGSARLSVTQQEVNPDEEFLDIIHPIQLLTLDLTFDGQTPSHFPNISYDIRTNQFKASTTRSVSPGSTANAAANEEDLNCTYVVLQTKELAWDCNYRTSRLSDSWTPILFRPVKN